METGEAAAGAGRASGACFYSKSGDLAAKAYFPGMQGPDVSARSNGAT
jgi:hypothetical protein